MICRFDTKTEFDDPDGVTNHGIVDFVCVYDEI